ncbi:MAG: permease [Nocardioides sp.]|uniref:permease n=1 Tax=Nocardioides sp. TaxID=35761 RepID=UPI0039E455BE
MSVMHPVLRALGMAGSMAWQIGWSLVLGFILSAAVQAVVRRETVVHALGDDRPATLVRATGLGAASSSCSYAAVALARSLFHKGASFPAAIVFELAATNLVIELGIIMAVLMGWQFTLAEFVGGGIIIVLMAVFLRLFVHHRLIDAARAQADLGLAGSMEGHAAMDMSIQGGGSPLRRILSPAGLTSIAHLYVMEWAAVIRDVLGGLLIAGAVAAWVPDSFWQRLFAAHDPTVAAIVGPLVGPLIAVLSFVCSVGNVPLATVLYHGGISFGGVTSFMFADLIIIPILLIYRKYYGTRMTLVLLGGFYLTMVIGGYLVEGIFHLAHLAPANSTVQVATRGVTWNYTTILDIFALLATGLLLVRFVRTGGREMLAMMGGGPNVAGHSGGEPGQDHRARP